MSCPNCSAPMAVDQRYCLSCGARGEAARLPFVDGMPSEPGSQLVPYTQPLPALSSPVGGGLPPRPVGIQEHFRVNSGLIAGVGVLLLALLIGVVIGQDQGESVPAAAAAPAPQIINLGGGVAAAPAAAPATGTTGATEVAPADTAAAEDTGTDDAADGAASPSSSTSSSPSSSSSSSPSPAAAAAPKTKDKANAGKTDAKVEKATVKASKSDLAALENATGADAQKAVEKLGKNIAVPGPPPKKDSKPVGGGTASEEIG